MPALDLEKFRLSNGDIRIPGLTACPDMPGRIRDPDRDSLLRRSLEPLQQGDGFWRSYLLRGRLVEARSVPRKTALRQCAPS